MRVGIYTFRITDRPTGLANYTIELTRALRALSPETDIIVLSPYQEHTLDWYAEFRIHHLKPSGSPLGPWIDLALAPFALRSAARELRLDVVHAPANVAPFLGLPPTVGRVATVHDLAPLTAPHEHRLISRVGYAAMLPVLKRTADIILTVSAESAADLVRLGRLDKDRVVVTPNGVSLPSEVNLATWRAEGLPELGLSPSTKFFLFVGDIRPRKNLAALLTAFEQVHSKRPDVKLVVAGQPMHRADATFEASRSLGDALIAPGYVSDLTLHRLYANAVALVMPSLAEGFGLPALEAMAHGTPAIASDLPVLRQIVGDTGSFVDPHDIGEIERALTAVLTDPALAGRLAIEGRARAETYSWRRTAELTLGAFGLAMKRRGMASG